MEFEDLTVGELRRATRMICQETKVKHSVAHTGTKQDLINYLLNKGVMPEEAKIACQFVKTYPEAKSEDDTVIEAELATTDESENAESKQEQEQEVKQDGNTKDSATEDELEIIRNIITKHCKADVDFSKVEEMIDSKLAEFSKKQVKTVTLKMPDGEVKPIGTCHKKVPMITQVAICGLNQMLVGPAGSGKTTACEQVAGAIGIDFHPMSVGPQTTKSDLLGFIDANGNYHDTPVRRAFEHGGLLLLDEMDAANPAVLTILNSLLSNGYCSFPDKVVQKSEKFICICACNTFGRGADRQYVGRNQLDAATLDRFVVQDFYYDEDFEKQLTGNDDWCEKVQKIRHVAESLKMRVVISPRASIAGAKLLAAGIKEKQVLEMTVWKGIAKEMRQKLETALN